MIQEPEDDRLDQSLRDTFSDFDLPPTSRVWMGIEGRLAAQPVPPRPVPLKLLLPVVGLVGVAVGWLLPRPTDKPTAKSTTTVQAYPRPAPKATDAAMAYDVAPQPATNSQRIQNRSTPAISRLVAASSAKSSKRPLALSQPVAPETAPVEAVASLEPTTASLAARSIPLSAAEVAAHLALTAQPTSPAVAPATSAGESQLRNIVDNATAPGQTQYATELPRHTYKGESLGEWRPEYRMPKHRTAERGLKLRRLRNHISKQWQQWFTPRRARSVQPAS